MKTIMKEMDYNGSGKTEILYIETDGDFALAVLNIRGSHPCAYIQFPEIEKIESYDDTWFKNGEDPDDWFDVHGGFTFLGTLERHGIDGLGLDGLWLGWDYAHAGDYFESGLHFGMEDYEKKWTTEEIVKEAREAIERVKKGQLRIEHDD